MTYNEEAIDRLSKLDHTLDVGITCYVSDTSYEDALQECQMEVIVNPGNDKMGNLIFFDTNGFDWDYVVPVIITPVELTPEPDMSINQVKTQDGTKQSVILKYFEYQHLPIHLQDLSKNMHDLSKNMHDLAHHMDQTLESGPEKSAGLRKLLEAKDCFIRAAL